MQSSIATAERSVFTASNRYPRHRFKVAWNRDVDETITFATVGTSIVGGKDIVQGTQTKLTKPDFFNYVDETDRVLKIETERILEEPLGGIAYAQADVTLDNNNLRFTPNVNSTVGTALLPNRPIKVFLGLQVSDVDKAVPNVYGLTGMPRENKANRTLEVHAFDYLHFINEFALETAMYQDQRSDQIIEDILVNKLSFSTDQFVLAEGLNVIPFAWFEKGTSAGEAIRRLCEAEEAVFYQDETGMLRFENRRKSREAPYNTPIWTINPEDVLLWEEEPSPIIINRCVVKANPREVQDAEEIWRNGVVEEVGPGDTITRWAQFEDPITSVTTPVASTDYIANSLADGTGTNLTSNISLTVTAFAKDAKIDIENTGGTTAFVTFLKLRGTPATITSPIQEIYEDDDSISKYDRHELVIENDFINSESFAYYMARALVRKYSEPRKTLVLTLPAIPTLQLRDIVRVKDKDQQGLLDDFNDNTTNTNLWSDVGDPPVTTVEANGQVEVTPGTNSTGYGGRQSVATYDLTGNAVSMRVIHPCNTTNNTETQMVLAVDDDNQILFVVTNNSIVCRTRTAGVNSDTFPAWSTNYKYWRIRESGGTIFFEVSSDNQEWTTLRSTTVSFSIKALQIRLQAGTYDNQPSPGSFVFDDVCFSPSDATTYKNYRVMRIQSQMFPGQYTQTLRLREIHDSETDAWAIVGSTLVGSTDEFVGI